MQQNIGRQFTGHLIHRYAWKMRNHLYDVLQRSSRDKYLYVTMAHEQAVEEALYPLTLVERIDDD